MYALKHSISSTPDTDYICCIYCPLYLHRIDCDGEGGVIPVHLILFAVLLVPHGALVSGTDPEHSQNDHKHQEADTHHDDDCGSTGYNFGARENKTEQRKTCLDTFHLTAVSDMWLLRTVNKEFPFYSYTPMHNA